MFSWLTYLSNHGWAICFTLNLRMAIHCLILVLKLKHTRRHLATQSCFSVWSKIGSDGSSLMLFWCRTKRKDKRRETVAYHVPWCSSFNHGTRSQARPASTYSTTTSSKINQPLKKSHHISLAFEITRRGWDHSHLSLQRQETGWSDRSNSCPTCGTWPLVLLEHTKKKWCTAQ